MHSSRSTPVRIASFHYHHHVRVQADIARYRQPQYTLCSQIDIIKHWLGPGKPTYDKEKLVQDVTIYLF